MHMGSDLRRNRRQTTINLFVGFMILLLVGGGGLVYLIYGVNALPTYLLCLGVGLAPLLLIGLTLVAMQWIVDRSG